MPSLMMFVGTHAGTEQLHSSTFLPEDRHVGDVARALLAGYLGACATLDKPAAAVRANSSTSAAIKGGATLETARVW